MSLNYIDKNGVSHIISGLTPGGNLETGAVATRKGTWSLPQTSSGNAYTTIVFTEPMPDADYEINLEVTSVHWASSADNHTPFMIQDKTANGFTIKFYTFNGFQSVNGNYTAFKLYEVADAEQLYSKVRDLESMVPSNASSTNKFTTADDLKTETKVLDRRLDDVEDAIPTTASITNKLVTQKDLSNVQIDKVEDINDVELTNIKDGQTLIWDNTNSKWVNGQGGKIYTAGDGINISNKDEISAKVDDTSITTDTNDALKVADTYKTIFVGTRAQWDALSAEDKKKYNIANITDDAIDCMTVDTITEGVMKPVTSNAVFDALDAYTQVTNRQTNVTINKGGRVGTGASISLTPGLWAIEAIIQTDGTGISNASTRCEIYLGPNESEATDIMFTVPKNTPYASMRTTTLRKITSNMNLGLWYYGGNITFNFVEINARRIL